MQMKKIIFLSLVILIVAGACSRNTISTKDPVIPKRDATLTALPIPTDVSQLDAATANDANAIASGKSIYQAKCARCHNLKDVGSYTEQRWDGILNTMAPRARLNVTEIQQVAAYIKANAKK